jgi:hypothetical protein
VVIKAKPKKALSTKKNSVMALGFDLSPASLSGCARAWDAPMSKLTEPAWFRLPWEKGTPHIDKLRYLAQAQDAVHYLTNELGIIVELPYIYIGLEDLPPRMMQAKRYREQAELIGAFLGGLLRWGYPNVSLISTSTWRKLVADDLEQPFKDLDKWHVKNWAKEVYDAPNWKDLIYNQKLGLIPKPKKSKAMPQQPDDRYDSTAIMAVTWDNIPEGVIIKV